MKFSTIMKHPSAFLPVAMSIAALLLVFITVGRFPEVVHATDEGAAAHTWQLLMGLQVPIVLWFVATWLPRAPKQTLYVLALQAAAGLAALAPVFILGL
jgi:hypothetical protein